MKKMIAIALVGFLAACGGGGDDDGSGGDASGGGGDATAGGDGGGGTPDSSGPAVGALCSEFPVTLTSGPTISPTQTGIVLCDAADAILCRATTNTYSDGAGACEAGHEAFFIGIDTAAGGSRRVGISNTLDWSIVSSDQGTVGDFGVDGIPDATPTRIIVENGDGSASYAFELEFQGQDVELTLFAQQI